MSALIFRALRSCVSRPLYAGYQAWTALNERWLNIETAPDASGVGTRPERKNDRGSRSERAVHDDNVYYEPLNYLKVRRVLRLLELQPTDVLYDLGCGKGRILCVAARGRMQRVIGVELFDELGAVARENARRLRGRKSPIDVVCTDATLLDYDDGTVFVLYNPFGEATMAAVLARLRDSWKRNPRDIRIGYYMALYEHLFAQEPWLEKYAEFESISCRSSFWRSKPAASTP